MANSLPEKIEKQIAKAGLPQSGTVPFVPSLVPDRKGRSIIKRAAVLYGPKKGKVGYVDVRGRIWVKDRAHAGVSDHWDIQEDRGRTYFRVGVNGEILP
jgi:hypothetical protein